MQKDSVISYGPKSANNRQSKKPPDRGPNREFSLANAKKIDVSQKLLRDKEKLHIIPKPVPKPTSNGPKRSVKITINGTQLEQPVLNKLKNDLKLAVKKSLGDESITIDIV